MTPFQFVDTYHNLPVNDSRLGLNVNLDLKVYKSGWFPDDQTKATQVLDAVARKCCGLKRGNADLPAVFRIGADPRVDPTEEFYCQGIRRAFGGRGSPDEIKDALRLAVLGGVTTHSQAKKYAEDQFGQDCNAFVGNYLGLSPMLAIPAYALGYGRGPIAGGTRDIDACRDLLPLPVRDDPTKVVPGDVIVTWGSLHPTHKWRWRHIALVEELKNVSNRGTKEGEAAIWGAELKIAEWGTAGGRAKHQSTKTIKLIADLHRWKPHPDWYVLWQELAQTMPGKKLVGFQDSDENNPQTLRFFLDASSLDFIWHRGLHIRNRFEGL